MMQEERVSVVIPTYNASKTIDDCLTSILKQDFSDYEVVVVDDGSTDDTLEKVKRYPVKLMRSSHQGAPGARNVGFEASKGNIVIFLDSDCIVGRNLIVNLIGPLQNPEIGVTQAWWDNIDKDKLVPSLIFKVYEYLVPNIEYPDYLWSYCFAIRRELFEAVGKFDPATGIGADDIELAQRIVKAGYRIYLMRELRVKHLFPQSLLAHIKRHIKTARDQFAYVSESKKFMYNQRINAVEYVKFILHGLTMLALFFIPLSPIPFLVLLMLSLSSHVPMTFWAMRDSWKYILILPFAFITELSWVVGSLVGLVTLLKKRENPRMREYPVKKRNHNEMV